MSESQAVLLSLNENSLGSSWPLCRRRPEPQLIALSPTLKSLAPSLTHSGSGILRQCVRNTPSQRMA